MGLFKLISPKNYISFFLTFFFVNILLIGKAEENKLNDFYSVNPIKYSQYDKLDNQLKMFFGFDSENSETSFYTDLTIISDSEYIRDMYNLKLNDMTINKINYSIKR